MLSMSGTQNQESEKMKYESAVLGKEKVTPKGDSELLS